MSDRWYEVWNEDAPHFWHDNDTAFRYATHEQAQSAVASVGEFPSLSTVDMSDLVIRTFVVIEE